MLACRRWVRLCGGAEAAVVALSQVRALAAAIRAWVCHPRLKPPGQGAAGAEGRPGRLRVGEPSWNGSDLARDGVGGLGL